MEKKIKSAMYGLITANAMAVPAIHRQPSMRHEKIVNMEGRDHSNQPPGTLEDAAEMTLCIAQSIGNKHGLDYDDMLASLGKWESSPASKFSTEDALPIALERFRSGIDALECGVDSEYGSASPRMLPVAIHLFLCYGENMLVYSQAMNEIWKASSITHTNLDSFALSAFYCGMVGKLLADKTLDEAIGTNLDILKGYFCLKGTPLYDLWSQITTKDDFYVQHCQLETDHPFSAVFDWATFLLLRGNNYRENVIRAVNAPVAAPDMLAAVVGCISGILYGFDNIPAEWISHVKDERIDRCCWLLEMYWEQTVSEHGIGYCCQNEDIWWK